MELIQLRGKFECGHQAHTRIGLIFLHLLSFKGIKNTLKSSSYETYCN
jgi:hypothetical protein